MASDTPAEALRVPWLAAMIQQPGVVVEIPDCRHAKENTEDALIGGVLHTPRTISSCICFYTAPPALEDHVREVHVAWTLGDQLNGHPRILHGGMVATLIDESMGIYKGVNLRRAARAAGGREIVGQAPNFTAELKVKYLRPVRTPTTTLITIRYVKKEGRKEWLEADMKQSLGPSDDTDQIALNATGEALFIEARISKL